MAKKGKAIPPMHGGMKAGLKSHGGAKGQHQVKPATKKTSGRRTMSPAARKKIAEAQRKRWAAVKKAAKAS